ncbi:MAG TPA: hypothetical protein VEO91_11230 [Candidatus Limnocylindria bacterium]|nr:hypothetical protein [Candidatus Limnocylindria bacterium]
MAMDTESRASRRNILAAALGGLGGLLAGRLGSPESAAANTGGNAILGQANTADAPTSFENTTDGPGLPSLVGRHSAYGTGVQGSSVGGMGVVAESLNHPGVWARSTSTDLSTGGDFSYRTGVVATAGDNALQATNTDETGVYGFSDISPNSVGVWGDSIDGIGVVGTGEYGIVGAGPVGVRAIGATALWTTGKLVFQGRSGRATVTAGHYYKDVAIVGMTTTASVIATLRTRKPGYYIAAVVSHNGKLRLFLNKTATSNIGFNYLVLN